MPRKRSTRRYKCPLPGCRFDTGVSTRMTDHEIFHDNPDAFTACGCGKQHGLRRYMQDCLRRQAGTLPERKKKKAKKERFACKRPGCEKSYANKRALTDHVILHDYPNAFICIQCGTKYGSRQSLRVCQDSHIEGRPTFPCDFEDCEKVFSLEVYLEDHQALHEDPLAWACPTCHRPHQSKRMQERCEINHRNHPEFGHRCPRPDCLAELPAGASLADHEKRHLNTREHTCSHEGCGRRFNLRSDAQRHFKVAHGSGYCRACKICGDLSKNMQDLLAHVRTEHAEDIQVFDLSEGAHADICENAILHLKAQYEDDEGQNIFPNVLRPDWELCQMSLDLRQSYNDFWKDLAKRVLDLGLYPVDGFRREVCAFWDDRKTVGASQVCMTPVQRDELVSLVAAKGWHAYGVAAHFKLTRSLERSWFEKMAEIIATDLNTTREELVAVARAALLAEILGAEQDPEETSNADNSMQPDEGEDDGSESEGKEERGDSEGASEGDSDSDSDSDSSLESETDSGASSGDDDGDSNAGDADDDDDDDGAEDDDDDDDNDDGTLRGKKQVVQQSPAKTLAAARRSNNARSRREAQEQANREKETKEKAAEEQALQALKEANKTSGAARRAAFAEVERRMREEDSDHDAEEEARKAKEGEEYRAAKAAEEKERQARKSGKFKPVHPSKRQKL